MMKAISSPQASSNVRPQLASPLWWKPWPVSPSVNQAIQDSFQTGHTPREMLGSATRLLLGWRTDQIPRKGDRGVASFFSNQAFKDGNFSEKPELAGVLGAVYGGGTEVWLHPVLEELDLFVARFGVMMHEIGGHLARYFGASGGMPGRLEAWWQGPIRYVDPFSLVTGPSLSWSSENEGLGAEWELAHRIPPDLRADWINAIWDAMGPDLSFLAIESLLKRRHYNRTHSDGGDEMRATGRRNALFYAYHLLANAHLAKARYIESMRELRFSGFWAMWVREFLFLEPFQGKRIFYALKGWELLKLGGAVALGASLF